MIRVTIGLVVVSWATFIISISSFAHEGHQPLPTNGVQVDFEHGRLTLSRQAREILGLTTVELSQRVTTRTTDAYASIEIPWTGHAFASARVSGKIVSVLVASGDEVVEGQVLAELSSRELQSLRLGYQQAMRDQTFANEVLRIVEPAVRSGSSPGQKLLDADLAVAQADNAVAIVRVQLLALGIEASMNEQVDVSEIRYPIRSPIAGVILHTDLAVGQYVEPNEHLFEILDNSKVWGRIKLLEKDAAVPKTGQQVQFSFTELSSPMPPQLIDRIAVAFDRIDQQLSAWTTISNVNSDFSLIPGMVGRASIVHQPIGERLIVPRSAIHSDGLQSYVFIEEASTNSSSELRRVSVLLSEGIVSIVDADEPYVEIIQGDVFAGDRVVLHGGHELSSLFFLGVLKLDEQGQVRLGIKVESVVERSIDEVLSLQSKIILPPGKSSRMSSQITGTIKRLLVAPGQSVRAGESLLEIAGVELQDLQIELLKSHLDAKLWRDNYNRLASTSGGAVSQRAILEARNQADMLDAKAESIRLQVLQLGFTESEVQAIIQGVAIRESLPVRSVIDGYVTEFQAVLGESVVANQGLIRVQDPTEILIEAYVPSKEIGKLVKGAMASVNVLAFPSQSIAARVVRLGPSIDDTNRARVVWLAPTESPPFRLVEKMLAIANVSIASRPSKLTVPKSALIRDGLNVFVFVKKLKDEFVRRRVEIGFSDAQYTQVTSGLEIGEQVVVAGTNTFQTAYASLR